jgi:hypothetical protein
MRARIRHRAGLLHREDGIALILAVLTLAVLTVVGIAIVSYTGANSRNASVSKESDSAHDLAEAGIAESLATIHNSVNNPFNPYLLPERTSTYAGGTVTWSGTFDQATSDWTITATGYVKNPTGPAAADIRRTVEAKLHVTHVVEQSSNNLAWNYIVSTQTGNTCDMIVEQSTDVLSPIFTEGNLCVQNTSRIMRGPLVVKGALYLYNPQNSVGASGSPINEAHIVNGCKWKNEPLYNPCVNHTPSTQTNVFATVIDTTPIPIALPTIDWDARYLNANPGPYYPCFVQSGIVPTFDNDQGSPLTPNAAQRNNSVPTVFNLTPSGTSYTCETAGGELSWDAPSKTLTVRGMIFIDGSVEVNSGAVANYDGQAVIFTSGTVLIKNSSLCAIGASTACATSGWNPNDELLIFVANGDGDGQVSDGNSIEIVSAEFQGGLIATNVIDINTTSDGDGPMWGTSVIIGQSTSTEFPTIDLLPSGAPGYPINYWSLGRPEIYG